MGKNTRPSVPRLKEIWRRQDPGKWGAAYEPSILATREEAPSDSRPAKVWIPKWEREFHLLSHAELVAGLLALHHPHLWEFQEQRILHTEARPHPLVGHESTVGMHLPNLRGTVDVAMRIGFLHLHPVVYMTDEEGIKMPVAFPFVGDLLLYMRDEQGPYCVNWTIKHNESQFDKSSHRQRPSRRPKDDDQAVRARHAIEEVYYTDVGIRTIRVTAKDIPESLQNNLQHLSLWLVRPLNVANDLQRMVVDRMQGCLLSGTPPLDAMRSLHTKHGIDLHDQKAILYQAIWRRELRVDLFGDPLHPDRPLPVEKTDVLVHFQSWFSRGAV